MKKIILCRADLRSLITRRFCQYSLAIVLLAILTLFTSSCSNKSEEQGPTAGNVNTALAIGEAIYTKNCKVCHAQGINGAPILGNKKMWAKRQTQPRSVLVEHAMEGFGLMPAKGGRDELTQEQISHAIDYMLSKLDM